MTHVFFRCHNRQFFLAEPEVAKYLIFLWAKYCKKYRIKIYEFIIMGNHAHLILRAPTPILLGDFMRTVNSQLARFINLVFDRDSQAIKDRYKSPLITSMRYLSRVMAYVWLNRKKVGGKEPLLDPLCSASWRFNPSIINSFSEDEEQLALLRNLLAHDPEIYPQNPAELRKFIVDSLSAATAQLEPVSVNLVHGHTIGDQDVMAYRTELLTAFLRERVPWRYDTDPPCCQFET